MIGMNQLYLVETILESRSLARSCVVLARNAVSLPLTEFQAQLVRAWTLETLLR